MIDYSPIQIGERKEKFWQKLTDLADLETGHTPSRYKPEYWGGDIDWISISDITLETIYVEKTKEKITQLGVDNSSARFLPKGTVLLSRGPTIGKLCILPKPMTTNQSFVGWVPKTNLDTKYLYYLLLCSRPYFDSIGVGATMKTIYMKDVKNFYIYSPPLEEQKRIVAKIDTLFAKIDKAISLTEESLKQTKNLLPSILNEVFEKFECDSNSYKLKDLCELITDGSHFSPKTKDNGLPYVTVRDVSWEGEIDLINCARISVDDFEKLKKGNCAPKPGDILYSKDGTVGKIAIVDKEKEFVVLSSLAIIRPTKRLVSKFLMYSMMSPKFYDFALSSKTGAAIKRIVLKTIKEFEISLPDIKKQLDAVNSIDEFSQYSKQTQSKFEEQLTYLKNLKSSILSKAFAGEL